MIWQLRKFENLLYFQNVLFFKFKGDHIAIGHFNFEVMAALLLPLRATTKKEKKYDNGSKFIVK